MLTLYTLLITYCSSTQIVQPEPIKPNARIQVLVEPEGETDFDVSTRKVVSGAASDGFAEGFVTGAVESLFCGTLAPLCFPIFSVVGGVTEAAFGAVSGYVLTISSDEQDAISELINSTFSSRTPDEILRDSFREASSERWELVDETPDQVVFLRLNELVFVQLEADSFSFLMSGYVRVVDSNQQSEEDSALYRFRHATPEHGLGYFLDQSTNNVNVQITIGIRALAGAMSDSLWQQ